MKKLIVLLGFIATLTADNFAQEKQITEIVTRGKGMVFISEVDGPVSVVVEYIHTGRISNGYMFRTFGGRSIELLDISFLDAVISLDGSGRWEELRDYILHNLAHVAVYRMDGSRIYIIGRSRMKVIGIHFIAVQT